MEQTIIYIPSKETAKKLEEAVKKTDQKITSVELGSAFDPELEIGTGQLRWTSLERIIIIDSWSSSSAANCVNALMWNDKLLLAIKNGEKFKGKQEAVLKILRDLLEPVEGAMESAEIWGSVQKMVGKMMKRYRQKISNLGLEAEQSRWCKSLATKSGRESELAEIETEMRTFIEIIKAKKEAADWVPALFEITLAVDDYGRLMKELRKYKSGQETRLKKGLEAVKVGNWEIVKLREGLHPDLYFYELLTKELMMGTTVEMQAKKLFERANWAGEEIMITSKWPCRICWDTEATGSECCGVAPRSGKQQTAGTIYGTVVPMEVHNGQQNPAMLEWQTKVNEKCARLMENLTGEQRWIECQEMSKAW